MDELLAAMYKVSVQLVPILGVAVLCFLIYLLRHCVTFIKELTVMVQKAGSAMEGVDKSIDKLQAPLDTVVRLDQVQESAVGAVKNMAGFMAGNLDSAREAAAARSAKKKPAPQPEPAAVVPTESDEPKTQSEGGTEHE